MTAKKTTEEVKEKVKKKVKKIKSKKYTDAIKKYDSKKEFSPEEGCSQIKELSTTKFDSTIEAHIRLNFDTTRDAVRGTVVLPHGTGKTKKVIVFADDKLAEEAKKAGAIEAGNKELITKIQQGWLDFDIVIAHPSMMPEVGKLGKILGTKGLMPNPKAGTVTTEVVKAVQEFGKGKVQFKADGYGIVHNSIGKCSFSSEQLKENLESLMEAVKKAKPAKTKGQYLVSLFLAPTMGPSVKISLSALK